MASKLYLSPNYPKALYEFVKDGYEVEGHSAGVNPIKAGTKTVGGVVFPVTAPRTNGLMSCWTPLCRLENGPTSTSADRPRISASTC